MAAHDVPATVQLAQTTMRSEMGKLELDKSFEERMLAEKFGAQWVEYEKRTRRWI